MNIHLIKSAELSAEVFTAVYDLLSAVDGAITIKCDPASVIDFSQEEIFSRFYEDEEAFTKMTEPPLYSLISSDSIISFPTYVRTASWGIMDSSRVKILYVQNFKQHMELSEVYIDPRNNNIYLPGFSNIEIKLRPLEKVLYFLFRRYPDGLFLSDLQQHKDELLSIYDDISFAERSDKISRINDLVNIVSNSASEKISRIKRAFEEAIGPDLAKHYYIQGGNGERKRVGCYMN